MSDVQIRRCGVAVLVLGGLCACSPSLTSGAGGGQAGGGDASMTGGGAPGGGSGVTGGGGGGGSLLDSGVSVGGGIGVGDGGQSSCVEISMRDFQLGFVGSQGAAIRAQLSTSLGDAAVIDTFSIQFYQGGLHDGSSVGTFDLSADSNWATCSRCVFVLQDYFWEQKHYFASSGSLVVDASSDILHGTVNATLSDVRLDEVTVEPSTYQTTLVLDGGCLHVASVSIAVAAPASPYPVNSDGGCGELELGLFGYAGHINHPPGHMFRTLEIYPLLNQPAVADFAALIVTDEAIDAGMDIGTFDLSQNGEDNLATCAHCMFISVDATQSAPTLFMASSGTLTVEDSLDTAAGELRATLSNVKLVESTYDSSTLLSTPVVNGRCLLVPHSVVSGR